MAMIYEDPSSAESKRKTREAYDRVGKKVPALLAKQLAQWWNKVLMDSKTLCLAYGCYDTGALLESIRIEMKDNAGLLGKNYERVVDVHPAMDRMIVAGGGGVINSKTKKEVDYAQAVHDGHISPAGKWVAGRPFLTDAVRNNISNLQEIMKRFGIDLENEWLKDE